MNKSVRDGWNMARLASRRAISAKRLELAPVGIRLVDEGRRRAALGDDFAVCFSCGHHECSCVHGPGRAWQWIQRGARVCVDAVNERAGISHRLGDSFELRSGVLWGLDRYDREWRELPHNTGVSPRRLTQRELFLACYANCRFTVISRTKPEPVKQSEPGMPTDGHGLAWANEQLAAGRTIRCVRSEVKDLIGTRMRHIDGVLCDDCVGRFTPWSDLGSADGLLADGGYWAHERWELAEP